MLESGANHPDGLLSKQMNPPPKYLFNEAVHLKTGYTDAIKDLIYKISLGICLQCSIHLQMRLL